jgi:hypothetical protein
MKRSGKANAPEALLNSETGTPTLTLANLIAYLANLDISREALAHALGNLSTVQLAIEAPGPVVGPGQVITANEARDLQAQLDIQNSAYEAVGRAIADNQVLDNALYYFRSLSK